MRAEAGAPDFITLFGHAPDLLAEAHGRVNLLGEHTDYNGGYVLPTLVPQRTRVELAATQAGDRVRVFSANVQAAGTLSYALSGPRRGQGWLDYVQGTTAALQEAGHAIGGFDARISSEVPLGSGLSSSAALEIALLRALRQAFGLKFDDVEMARIGQRAENDFVGAPVGIMDQMACSLAEPGSALFLDTRSLAYQQVQIPAAAELCVIDSGVSHSHAGGQYAVRRAECQRACALLRVQQLRELGPSDLQQAAALPEPLGRRVRHVVCEEERVLAAVAALRAGDLSLLGDLIYAGHASLRDDYEVSTPELDLLVEVSRGERDVYGARLTGGGFGGAVVMVAAAGRGRAAAHRIAAAYGARTGRRGIVLVPMGEPMDKMMVSDQSS